jgi:hypothetical protein
VTADPARLADCLADLSLAFIAGAPTPEHAATHVAIARERGVDETRIAAALALSAANQEADIQRIEESPR